MSLYGALYAGVAGLNAQSNKLGIISDNIANVGTVGYKGGQAEFETLVTSSSNTTAYSPGGVLGSNQQLVTTQGLLNSTSSPTDIAISGSGFFVVNQKADQSGQVLYTRAGSFTQNAKGNFSNASGYFLQAWPLDHNGNLPGAPGNLDTDSAANLSSLQTVNVENLTGTASPTTNVTLSANLNSGQKALKGAGVDATMDTLDVANHGISANTIIVPTAVDGLHIGDGLTVATGAGVTYTYNYGGFTTGRNIVTGAGGDAGTTLNNGLANTLAADPFTSAGTGNSTVVVADTNAINFIHDGDVVQLTATTGVGNITAAQLTGSFIVSNVDANGYTITTTGVDNTGGVGGGTVTDTLRLTKGGILDAINPSQPLLGATGTAAFSPAALSFTITTSASGTAKFTYTATSPNIQLQQFNTLNNLADAINSVVGLTARVSNGKLYVGATDATAAITFADGASVGTLSGSKVQSPIHWVNELGLQTSLSAGLNRFSSLQSLSSLVKLSPGITGTLNNPLGASDLSINVNDPLDTISFTDGALNNGSVLAELGLGTSQNGGPFAVQTTGNLGPAYDPANSAKNMSSGAVPAQFTLPVNVFDSLGTSHSLTAGFIKTGSNTWAVEIYSKPATDVNSALPSGQVASGTIVFNGDGSLRSVQGLSTAIPINWTNGAASSKLTYNWGTAGQPFGTVGATIIGKTDGLSQFDSGYNVNSANQNGAPVGQLTGISIDSNGFIIAAYNNGQTAKLYKIPLAEFTDPDHLQSNSGNAYIESDASGVVNLKQAGQSGVGTISSGALESSNVELASQLTDMIVAQRAYQANTKVIQTADSLLNALDQIIQ